MAAIQATFVGIAYGPGGGQSPITIVGDLSYTGLGVGGGPMPGGPPGPSAPVWPQFPIAGYPDFPYPSQPIYRPGYPGGALPPSFPLPPDLPPTLPPPDSRPVDWKTAWTPETGWIVVGIPTGPTPTPSAAPTKK